MRLAQLKKSWTMMSVTEKLDLIEQTNDRRMETFQIRTTKAVKKKRKASTSRKKSVSKKAKTPEGLLELMKNMTPEEKKNFQLMIQLGDK